MKERVKIVIKYYVCPWPPECPGGDTGTAVGGGAGPVGTAGLIGGTAGLGGALGFVVGLGGWATVRQITANATAAISSRERDDAILPNA